MGMMGRGHQESVTQVRSAGEFISKSGAHIRVLTRVPVKARVGFHDHRLLLSSGLGEEMKLVFSDGKFAALIEDPDRGISYLATAKVSGNRMYIYIPKRLWQLYDRGKTVKVIVTPLEYLTKGAEQ